MSDAWSTIVARESEWDDYSRAEAIAGVTASRMVCKECGLPDGMVRDMERDLFVRWDEQGRKFVVEGYRCLSCASMAVADRKLGDTEEVRDGRRRVVREVALDAPERVVG